MGLSGVLFVVLVQVICLLVLFVCLKANYSNPLGEKK